MKIAKIAITFLLIYLSYSAYYVPVPSLALSFTTPGNMFKSPVQMSPGDKYTVTLTAPRTVVFFIQLYQYFSQPPLFQGEPYETETFTIENGQFGYYYIVAHVMMTPDVAEVPYTINIVWEANGQQYFDDHSFQYGVDFAYDSIRTLDLPQNCELRIRFTSRSAYQKMLYVYQPGPMGPIPNYLILKNVDTSVIISQTGVWKLRVNSRLTDNYQPSASIAYFSTNCANPYPPAASQCFICGDGIRSIQEQCDNRHQAGCINCAVDPKYKCKGAAWEPSVCILKCGDSIRDNREDCDNGNQAGCSKNCKADYGYICYGSVGSISRCTNAYKPSASTTCGDSIRNDQEICDNGNRTGCSKFCVPDPGFKCYGNVGGSSFCFRQTIPLSTCGNKVIDSGEQCDNGHRVGCSKNCQIDDGYYCVGTSSLCFKKPPGCGNGINKVGQDCDDGNRVNSDGCSQKCIIQESGFQCLGKLGSKTICIKLFAKCGNGIFQPSIPMLYTEVISDRYTSTQVAVYEQCDNSNQLGC